MSSSDILGTNLDVGCIANLCKQRYNCTEHWYNFSFISYIQSSYQRIAIFIGVVRHDVNISAGRFGFIGKIWLAAHAANWIQFL